MMDHEFSNDVQCIIQKSSLLYWKEVIRVEIAVAAAALHPIAVVVIVIVAVIVI